MQEKNRDIWRLKEKLIDDTKPRLKFRGYQTHSAGETYNFEK